MVQTPATRPERPLRQTTEPRSTDRRREILAVAANLFRERGLAATGMRDIAAALGMAVGNLYYYFASKEELLAFCQEEGLAGLESLMRRVRTLPLPAEARLYLLVVGHVRQINERTPGAIAHLGLELVGGERRGGTAGPLAPTSGLVAARRRYQRAMRELVEEGVETGRLRPHDAKLATLAILGAVNWTARWFDPRGSHDATAVGVALAEQLVRGLLAPDVTFTPPTIPAWMLGPAAEDAGPAAPAGPLRADPTSPTATDP
jgi:AcrR family transcriptional regulator